MTQQREAVHHLRDMNSTQLQEHLLAQRRKLFEIRMQQATGQVENFRQIRALRKEIARTMTIQAQQSAAEGNA